MISKFDHEANLREQTERIAYAPVGGRILANLVHGHWEYDQEAAQKLSLQEILVGASECCHSEGELINHLTWSAQFSSQRPNQVAVEYLRAKFVSTHLAQMIDCGQKAGQWTVDAQAAAVHAANGRDTYIEP